ncbi:MAG: hypothetical protein ACTHU0_23670 [Kofleriaceae bacterium]
MSGDDASRLTALTAQLEQSPLDAAARAEGDGLAGALGGELALHWRIAVVRAVIAAPPDGDAVREAYGELVDLYRDEPAGLAALRPLGEEIRRLELEGTLPRTLVARSARRPRR